MKDKTIITITGLICVSVLESIALIQKVDGALFALAISVIAGAIGVKVGRGSVGGKRRRG